MTLKQKQELHEKIAAYIAKHPEMTFAAIGQELGISLPTISKIAIGHGLGRRDTGKKHFTITDQMLARLEEM